MALEARPTGQAVRPARSEAALTAVEELVAGFGAVRIDHVPENEPEPWTVSLLDPVAAGLSASRSAATPEWWNHCHGASIDEAVAALLRMMREGLAS